MFLCSVTIWLSFKVKVTSFCVIFGQYSWKLLHPTDKYGNPNCPEEAEEYERVSHAVLYLVQLLCVCNEALQHSFL